jgi:hypothetical protein
MTYGYLIVIKDNASENYSYGIPEDTDTPQVIFTSYQDAKVALETAAAEFEEFLPVAYGKAYPYDSVSFDDEIDANSFAPFGWGLITTDDGVLRVCVGLLRMTLN